MVWFVVIPRRESRAQGGKAEEPKARHPLSGLCYGAAYRWRGGKRVYTMEPSLNQPRSCIKPVTLL